MGVVKTKSLGVISQYRHIRNIPTTVMVLLSDVKRYRQANKAASLFDSHFTPVIANTEALRQAVFKTRYAVYCKEMKTEAPNVSEMEIDCFDKHSLHCLIQHKTSGVYAGTVRIIKPDFPNETLAIEKNNCIPTDDPALVLSPPNFRRDQIGEISRLAILRQFRHRYIGVEDHPYLGRYNKAKIACSMLPVALYLSAAALAECSNRHHIYVMVEPRLAKSMARAGVIFGQIGPVIDYHGKRAPYYINLGAFKKEVKPSLKKLHSRLRDVIEEQVEIAPR